MGREARDKAVETAWTMTGEMPDAAFVCIEGAVDASAIAGDYEDASALLQEFAARVPGHVQSLQKLIEICVDGKLESAMKEAQAQLADAYLETGQAAEARIIAEDLVAREPWETAHIERFRKALRMLKVWDRYGVADASATDAVHREGSIRRARAMAAEPRGIRPSCRPDPRRPPTPLRRRGRRRGAPVARAAGWTRSTSRVRSPVYRLARPTPPRPQLDNACSRTCGGGWRIRRITRAT